MSPLFQRLARLVLAASFIASLALLVESWLWRGYESPLEIRGQPVAALAFAPQGDILAVGSLDSSGSLLFKPVSPIRFLNASTGAEVRPPLATHATGKPSVARAEYSPDGKLLAVLQPTTSDEVELVIFDLQNDDRVAVLTANYFSGGVGSLENQVAFEFAPDNSFAYLSGPVPKSGNWFSRSLTAWDLAAGEQRFALAGTGHPAVSPDSRWLVTVDDLPPNEYSKNLVLAVHSAKTGETERTIELAGNQRMWLWPSFSPDGRLLAVYAGGRTEVFEMATGQRVFEQKTFGPKFLADGTLMTVAGNDVQLWDPATWKLKQTHTFQLGRHWDNGDQISPVPAAVPRQPRFVVFNYYPSRNPSWLRGLTQICRLNAYGSNQMTLVDAADASRRPIELHKNQLTSGAIISPGGRRIAVSYLGGDIEVWKLPPQPSYVAPCIAAGVMLVALGALLALGRGRGWRRQGDQ